MSGADSRYYTADDISDMPLQVVNYAKNEIYALHGRLFDSAELAGYFSQQPWYSGSLRKDDFTDKVFNEYERENILLLNDREMALSDGNGYVLDQPGYNYDAVSQYLAARNGNIRAEALLMRLWKIIGTVSLKDGDGEAYDVEENMRLFRGSILGTKSESSAVVDLDEVKLAILDERSRAAYRTIGGQAGETSQPAEPDASGGEGPLPEDGGTDPGGKHQREVPIHGHIPGREEIPGTVLGERHGRF